MREVPDLEVGAHSVWHPPGEGARLLAAMKNRLEWGRSFYKIGKWATILSGVAFAVAIAAAVLHFPILIPVGWLALGSLVGLPAGGIVMGLGAAIRYWYRDL